MNRVIKIVPNSLTLFRIIMAFIFMYFIIMHFQYNNLGIEEIIIVFLAICFSDLLDGKIARKMEVTSEIGAKLDVVADLLYIVTSYITLIVFKIMPIWFLLFVFFKFFEFIITSNLIRGLNNSDNFFIFDPIGRVVSAIFFIIPGMFCVSMFVDAYIIKRFVNYFLYVVMVFGFFSSYLRIKNVYMLIKKRI
ncbi:CDP-alcohol phosphatidyltransferase family protein [Clostridium felsineum]|uniref:CDP-alcohol phosphatidyltransferase family protein n=1 Tax=Clostridium felsineum TaxID=36839 RepID=UPI0009D1628C|nr:CDP-alcohol phosphatidyltransferase family protein [Clostridium felsineum]URZ03664.1 hypothetical protein CLAUR_037250 [Clostridium felsineum]